MHEPKSFREGAVGLIIGYGILIAIGAGVVAWLR